MILSVTEKTFGKEILQAPSPILVHFWAPWCGLCLLINPVLANFERDWQGQIKVGVIVLIRYGLYGTNHTMMDIRQNQT